MPKPVITLQEKICIDIALDPEREKKFKECNPSEVAATLATAYEGWQKVAEFLKKKGAF